MTKKSILVAALALGMVASRASAQIVGLSCPPMCPGIGYAGPISPYVGYGYPPYGYYPYPLPPAPSYGFGRGGIYGHTFVPRDDVITGFTLPGGSPDR
jgi:hypothetical protein